MTEHRLQATHEKTRLMGGEKLFRLARSFITGAQ
jgi:hypothetical protein